MITTANFKQVFDFLNSIAGDGYGGMAEFEIACETMRRASTAKDAPFFETEEEASYHAADPDGWKYSRMRP